jgi:putative heme-binding domain-containing protein
MTFGYGAKFPAKYQQALYALDWSWGKIYAVHLAPKGASYTATKEEFVTGGPLPVTDAFIHPKDGAMYFAIGGRKVQSGLYRVSYIGKESTAGVDVLTRPTDEAKLRQQLEAYHGVQDSKSIDLAWPHLNSADRNIRWAARTVLEHQPLAQWQGRALKETDAARSLEALLAVARVGAQCPNQSPRAAKPDRQTGVPVIVAQPTSAEVATRDGVLDALLRLDWAKLTNDQRIAWVRISQIVLHRYGTPDAARVQQIVGRLDPAFPANNFELNWVLCETLAFLQAPNTAAKGMALIANAESQEPQMEYARSLRFLKAGWTPALRQAQLNWFLQAANYRGGSSFTQFIQFIRNDSLATFTDAEKQQHAALIAQKAVVKSPIENAGAMFAGRTPKAWTLAELDAAVGTGLKDRNFDTGRKAFAAAACFTCHRFGNAGGMTGPDLTLSGGRYSPHDFLDQIINPSKEINEQFAPIIVTKNNGDTLTGVIVNLNGDTVVVNTDLSDPDQRVNVDRKEVKSIERSAISPMPPMLLSMLTQDEILDLVAYVLSGGDKEKPVFKKAAK